jgi:hypothetical protein
MEPDSRGSGCCFWDAEGRNTGSAWLRRRDERTRQEASACTVHPSHARHMIWCAGALQAGEPRIERGAPRRRRRLPRRPWSGARAGRCTSAGGTSPARAAGGSVPCAVARGCAPARAPLGGVRSACTSLAAPRQASGRYWAWAPKTALLPQGPTSRGHAQTEARWHARAGPPAWAADTEMRASLKSVTGWIWKACTRFLLSKSLILPWMRTYTPTPHSAACTARTTRCVSPRAVFSSLAHQQTCEACWDRSSRQARGRNTNSVSSLAHQLVHAIRACKLPHYLTC